MKRLLLALIFVFVGVSIAGATVNITTSRIQYSCNGSTTVFTYPFKVYEDDDLDVLKADSSGNETTLILNSQYTVSGSGDDAGGDVTLTAGSVCGSGSTLTILRDIDITQSTNFVDWQRISAASLEAPPDKSRIIDQQLNEVGDRSLKLPRATEGVSPEVPAPSAFKLFRWNATATALEEVSAADLFSTSVTTIGEGLQLVGTDLSLQNDYTQTHKTLDIITKGPVADVRAFGAIGDGITDDTVAIQAAIDSLVSFIQTYDYSETADLDHGDAHEGVGGTVLFPKGVYKITSALTLTSAAGNWGVNFRGVGNHASVILVTGSGTNGFTIVGTGGDGMRSVSFKDLKIRGEEDGGSWPSLTGDGINLNRAGKQIYFSNVWIDHMGGDAIEINNVANMITLKDCRLSRNNRGLVATNNAEQIWLYGNSIRLNTGAGVYIGGFNNIVGIYGGDIHGNGTGVNIFSAADAENTSITIDGIYFEDNDKDILVDGGSGAGSTDRPRNVIVRGNSFKSLRTATNNCVEMSACVGCVIEYNEFRDQLVDKPGNLIRLGAASERTKIGLNSFEVDSDPGIDFTTTNYISNAGVNNYGYIDNDDRTHWISNYAVTVNQAFGFGAPVSNTTFASISSTSSLDMVSGTIMRINSGGGTSDELDFIERPNEPGRLLIFKAYSTTITINDNTSTPAPPAGYTAIQTSGTITLDINDQLMLYYDQQEGGGKWKQLNGSTN
jgi:hypothetical protein